MRKPAFAWAVAFMAAVISLAPTSAVAEDSTKISVGGGGDFWNPTKGRSWGDGAAKDGGTPDGESGSKIQVGVKHEHDGTTSKPIGGTTKDGSKDGGWWAQWTGGGKWSLQAGGEYDRNSGEGKGGLKGEGSFGGSIGGGAQTSRWGNDFWNVQGRIKGELYAEIKGALEVAIKNDGEFVGGIAEGEVGAAIGARGSLEGNTTLFGIPVTLGVEGEALVGAKAKGGVKVGYDKKTKKFVIKHGASLAWGLGAGYNVVVAVDAGKLCETLGLTDLWKEFSDKNKGGDDGDDPFDSEPTGGGRGGGGRSGYKGLKTFKLVD